MYACDERSSKLARIQRRGGWAPLERVLDERQIDRAEFQAQATRAIEESWRSPADDPTGALTALEAALLTEAGLDLAARREGEPDIVVRTAVGLAVLEATSSTVADVAAAMRVTSTRVRQRAAERTLYAIRVDDEWRFPDWQFDERGRALPGIAKVTAALAPGLHPLAVWRFMNEPRPDLEIVDEQVSPLQWLRAGGDPEPVIAIARTL